MASYKPKACEQCGTEFTSRQPNAKYCTSTCRDRAKYLRTKNSPTPRTQKQCAGCGKAFTPHHPLAAYCTKKCQKTAEARRRRQQKSPNRGTASKTCATCNTPFTPNTPATKYCSSTCRKEAKRKSDREFMREWRAKTPNGTPSAANGKTASSTDNAHAVGANNTPKKRKPKPKHTAKQTAHQRASECVDGWKTQNTKSAITQT